MKKYKTMSNIGCLILLLFMAGSSWPIQLVLEKKDQKNSSGIYKIRKQRLQEKDKAL